MNTVQFFVVGVVMLWMVGWGVVLLARHTTQSIALGLGLLALGVPMLWTRVNLTRARLKAGLNPITGLRRTTA